MDVHYGRDYTGVAAMLGASDEMRETLNKICIEASELVTKTIYLCINFRSVFSINYYSYNTYSYTVLLIYRIRILNH